jgi:hypothetical protein
MALTLNRFADGRCIKNIQTPTRILYKTPLLHQAKFCNYGGQNCGGYGVVTLSTLNFSKLWTFTYWLFYSLKPMCGLQFIVVHCKGLETFEFLVYTLYSKTKTNSTFIAYSKVVLCKHNLVLSSSKDKKEYWTTNHAKWIVMKEISNWTNNNSKYVGLFT